MILDARGNPYPEPEPTDPIQRLRLRLARDIYSTPVVVLGPDGKQVAGDFGHCDGLEAWMPTEEPSNVLGDLWDAEMAGYFRHCARLASLVDDGSEDDEP